MLGRPGPEPQRVATADLPALQAMGNSIADGVREDWPHASEESIARYVAAITVRDTETCHELMAQWAIAQYQVPPTVEENLEAETNPDAILRRHGLLGETRNLDLAARRDLARGMLRRRSMIVAGGPGAVRSLHAPARRVTPRRRGAGRPRAVSRSSSRGGDSGDSSSGESDPPQLARLRRAFRRARFERVPGSAAVRIVFRPEERP